MSLIKDLGAGGEGFVIKLLAGAPVGTMKVGSQRDHPSWARKNCAAIKSPRLGERVVEYLREKGS